MIPVPAALPSHVGLADEMVWNTDNNAGALSGTQFSAQTQLRGPLESQD
jgi:hypothetical protein